MKNRKRNLMEILGVVLLLLCFSSICWAEIQPMSECNNRGLDAADWPVGCGVGSVGCVGEYSCESSSGPVVPIDNGTEQEEPDSSAGCHVTGRNCTGCPTCCPTQTITVGGSMAYTFTESWSSSLGAEGGFLFAKITADLGHSVGRSITSTAICTTPVPPCKIGGIQLHHVYTEGIKKSMTTTVTLYSKNIEYEESPSVTCTNVGVVICEDDMEETETVTYDVWSNASCIPDLEQDCH